MEGIGLLPLLLLFFSACQGVLAIRLIRLGVPETVREGDDVRLTCDFDMEGSELSRVTWYLGTRWVHIYEPGSRPANYFFPLRGLNVDEKKSGNGVLYLMDVSPANAGTYQCGVQSWEPSYENVLFRKTMRVISKDREPNGDMKTIPLKY